MKEIPYIPMHNNNKRLSSTYKIPAFWLVNEHEIFRIFEGGIFFEQSDWLSAQIVRKPIDNLYGQGSMNIRKT